MYLRYPLAALAIALLGTLCTIPEARADCPFDSTLFGAAIPLLSGAGGMEGAAVCDLNGDGVADVALAPGGTPGYRFLLANTTGGAWNGTFTLSNGPTFLGTAGHGLATADLNHDGKPDVVTIEAQFLVALLSPASGQIAGGSPSKATVVLANGLQPRIADLDRDGFLDVVLARDVSGVSVVKGVAAAPFGYGFGATTTYAVGSHARDVALADFDHDGAEDMVVATTVSDLVVLPGLVDALANPTGSFGPTHPLNMATAGRQCWSVIAADLDEDGWEDIVAAVRDPNGPGSIVVRMNQGDGTFGPPIAYAVNGQPKSLLAIDANKDGTLDIVAAATDGATLSLLQGVKTGDAQRYALQPPIPLGVPSDGTMLAGGDIDNDGSTDVVVPGTNTVALRGTCQPGLYSINRVVSGPGRVDRQFGSGRLASVGSFVRLLPVTTSPEFHFSGWFDDTSGTDNPLQFTTSRNRTYRAAFSRNTYTLNVTLDGGGTVTRIPDLPTYVSGTVVNLIATPAVGYLFANWSGDATGPNVSTTVTMLGGNKNVTAHFTTSFVPLSVSVVGGGHVQRDPDLPQYPINSTVTLTAIADDGWQFDHWSGDVTNDFNPLSLVMASGRAVTATFVHDPRSPLIIAVRDLPADQGGRVKLEWNASSLDAAPPAPGKIGSYLVFRDVPTVAALRAIRAGTAQLLSGGAPIDGTRPTYLHTVDAAGDFFWEYLATVPAAGFPGYSFVAPTTLDSSAAGPAWTRFKLQARTNDNTAWYNSPPDSGQSVDNLAPQAPAPLAFEIAAGGNDLHWGPNHEPDLQRYRVYRGSSPDFVPGPVTFLAAPVDTTYLDATTSSAWYKVTAVDVHGNESVASTVFASRTTGVGDTPPTQLAISASPNPGPGRTVFTLSLPNAAHVRVSVLDASGRRVAALMDDDQPAGRTSLAWRGRDDGGHPVAGGLYFALVEAGGTRVVTRVVLLQ